MAARVPNIAKGRAHYYASLPAADDALIAVLLKSGGPSALADLEDLDTLAAILAVEDECDFTGYARRTLAGVTAAVNDTTNVATVDADDPASYTNTDAAQSSAFYVVCYDPDTTGGTDADLIPIYVADCVVTFDTGVAVSVAHAASGLATFANPA